MNYPLKMMRGLLLAGWQLLHQRKCMEGQTPTSGFVHALHERSGYPEIMDLYLRIPSLLCKMARFKHYASILESETLPDTSKDVWSISYFFDVNDIKKLDNNW